LGAGDAVADIRRADDGDGRVRLVGASGSDGNESGEQKQLHVGDVEESVGKQLMTFLLNSSCFYIDRYRVFADAILCLLLKFLVK
jgi:hypothetical protein